MFNFKLEAIDGSVRAGVVKEAGYSIPTPMRVLNSNELEHSKKVNTSGLARFTAPHPVFEITKYLWPSTVNTFVKNGAASYGFQKQIEDISNKAGQRITLFHPILDRGLDINDRINDVITEMQLQINTDAIAILDRYNSNPLQFEDRLTKSIRSIEKADSPAEPMPILRLDTDDRLFGEKLKILLKHGIKIANLIYAPIKQNFQNYTNVLKHLKEEDIWIHMSELGRTTCKNSSLIHLMPMFGIDSFAMKSRPLPIGKFEKKFKAIKRFDAGTLGHITPDMHKKLYGEDLNCDCFVDDGRTLTSFIDEFNGAELLKSALICHETYSSYEEFRLSRTKIVRKAYYDYLRQKQYAYAPIKKFLNIDLKNKSLT